MTSLGSQPTTADFRGLSWALARTTYFVATLALLPAGFALSMAGKYGSMLGPALVLLGIAISLMPSKIRMDTDGIAIRWLWVRRFIRYDDIAGAACYDEMQWSRWREIGLRIELRSGEPLYLPMRHLYRLAAWRRDPTRVAEVALSHLLMQRDDALARAAAPPERAEGEQGGKAT